MRQDIEDYRNAREIPFLLHFTREENTESILSHGLAPRSHIDSGNIAGTTNDPSRNDGRRSFNCLSIAFPNNKMFYKLRNDDPSVEWPILVIHPKIISVRRTLFCQTNAASGDVSGKPDDQLESLSAFKALFDDVVGCAKRAEQQLKSCDPTDVQAEVLVEGIIPPEAIYSIVFPSQPCLQRYAAFAGQRQVMVNDRRGLYGTREYYRRWGHGK